MRKYVIFILSIAFMLFSLYPAWYEIQRKDTIRENRTFELVHNFYTDFNFYLSRIRQGLEGNLTVHEKYTSEPHNGSFIHILYLAMGWEGRWVRVPWHRTADICRGGLSWIVCSASHLYRIFFSVSFLWHFYFLQSATSKR